MNAQDHSREGPSIVYPEIRRASSGILFEIESIGMRGQGELRLGDRVEMERKLKEIYGF